MNVYYYVLDEEGKPVPEPDALKWGRWFEQTEKRIIGRDSIEYRGKMYTVSTVFLGIDHNFFGKGPPILYETMIFSEEESEVCNFQERYTDRLSALAGHRGAMLYLQSGRLLQDGEVSNDG